MNQKPIPFLLSMLFLSLFSCSDHYIPETPPVIETERFQFIPMRTSDDVRQYSINWFVTFTGLGTVGIEEYGIVYRDSIHGDSVFVGAATSHLIPFSEDPVLGTNKKSHAIDQFTDLYYRAYAKLENGQTIYGEILQY